MPTPRLEHLTALWQARPWLRLGLLAGTLLAAVLVAAAAPAEASLGAGARLVYFHGAWVWAGLLVFAAAALAGLAGLLGKRAGSGWSLALGRTGLFFWLTYLPMSLAVMQLNWGGFYFDEPRWRIPFAFAVAGVLLQLGLWVMGSPALTSLGNLVFGTALWASLMRSETILHPDSPIFQGGSARIQVFFVLLLALMVGFAAQMAAWLHKSHP